MTAVVDAPAEQPQPDEVASRARRVLPWAIGLLALTGVVLAMMARSDGRTPDDAFIFFRYARNIAEGHGWTYNVGESTSNGATSPLWAVLLAGAYALRPSMESNAWFLYAASLAGAALLTFAALRRTGRTVAGGVAALAMVMNPTLLWVRGMESALMLCLAAALAFVGVFRRSPWLTGVLGGLLVLVRPEGAILLLLVLAMRWREGRGDVVRAATAAAVTLLPWIVYSTIEFGTPVAGTLAAKTAQGASGYFGPPFVFIRYLRTMAMNSWSLALLVFGLPGLVHGLLAEATRRYVAVVAGFAAATFAAYGLVVRPPAYLWYYASAYWGLAVLAGLGVSWLADQLVRPPIARRERDDRLARPARVLTVGLCACLLAGLMLRGQIRDDIYTGYRQAAEWLRRNGEPDATVAAAEIGVLGWTSELPVVDYLGLLSRQSADEVARGDLTSWIGREQPDFYVQHVPIWDMEKPSREVRWFDGAYELAYESSPDEWNHVRVYRRVATMREALRASGRP